jgi:hypothetical protein
VKGSLIPSHTSIASYCALAANSFSACAVASSSFSNSAKSKLGGTELPSCLNSVYAAHFHHSRSSDLLNVSFASEAPLGLLRALSGLERASGKATFAPASRQADPTPKTSSAEREEHGCPGAVGVVRIGPQFGS